MTLDAELQDVLDAGSQWRGAPGELWQRVEGEINRRWSRRWWQMPIWGVAAVASCILAVWVITQVPGPAVPAPMAMGKDALPGVSEPLVAPPAGPGDRVPRPEPPGSPAQVVEPPAAASPAPPVTSADKPEVTKTREPAPIGAPGTLVVDAPTLGSIADGIPAYKLAHGATPTLRIAWQGEAPVLSTVTVETQPLGGGGSVVPQTLQLPSTGVLTGWTAPVAPGWYLVTAQARGAAFTAVRLFVPYPDGSVRTGVVEVARGDSRSGITLVVNRVTMTPEITVVEFHIPAAPGVHTPAGFNLTAQWDDGTVVSALQLAQKGEPAPGMGVEGQAYFPPAPGTARALTLSMPTFERVTPGTGPDSGVHTVTGPWRVEVEVGRW